MRKTGYSITVDDAGYMVDNEGFYIKDGHPLPVTSTNRNMTRGRIEEHFLNIDKAFMDYEAYASNQLVPYHKIQPLEPIEEGDNPPLRITSTSVSPPKFFYQNSSDPISAGTISMTVTGGLPMYEYKIDDGEWTSATPSTEHTFLNITELKTYTLYVRDSVGDIAIAHVNIPRYRQFFPNSDWINLTAWAGEFGTRSDTASRETRLTFTAASGTDLAHKYFSSHNVGQEKEDKILKFNGEWIVVHEWVVYFEDNYYIDLRNIEAHTDAKIIHVVLEGAKHGTGSPNENMCFTMAMVNQADLKWYDEWHEFALSYAPENGTRVFEDVPFKPLDEVIDYDNNKPKTQEMTRILDFYYDLRTGEVSEGVIIE